MTKTKDVAIDMTGQRVGTLTVMSRAPSDLNQSSARWNVRCDCGVEKSMFAYVLRKPSTKSCGAGVHQVKHGLHESPEYTARASLIARCTNELHPKYADYGGRGITVCPEWSGPGGFEQFYKDMGPRPGPGFSIDRIDNNKGYSKENCKWSTATEQMYNRRNTRRLTVNGVTKTEKEWADQTGLPKDTIRCRIRMGWTPEEAVLTPKSATGRPKIAAAKLNIPPD